jgi:ATP-dependent DNA helicase Q4
MPKTLENYIQEIGRAGRDGRTALCHMFLAKEDYVKHRSFAFSDYPDPISLLKVLQKLYPAKLFKIKKERTACLDVHQCEKELDIPEANLATILCYIELEYPVEFRVQPAIDGSVTLYLGRTNMEEMIKDTPFFASIESLATKAKAGLLFNVFDVDLTNLGLF